MGVYLITSFKSKLFYILDLKSTFLIQIFVSQILPKWEAVKTGTLSFKFRTNEPNGLLMFNMGAKPPRVGCTVRGGAFGGKPV